MNPDYNTPMRSNDLLVLLRKSAEYEAIFGNDHAELLFAAADRMEEYDAALRLAVRSLEEGFGPLASEWPIIRNPLRGQPAPNKGDTQPMNTKDQNQPPAAGQAAHTPTPWLSWPDFNENGETGDILIGRNTASPIVVVQKLSDSCPVEANAAFIVRACNSYAANQAEIARLRAEREELLGALKLCAMRLRQVGAPDGSLAIIAAEKADSLIQKAQGGSK